MNKKYIILCVIFLLTVTFLTYCFYPVINYDTRYSQHVNHSPNESLAPGRILLTDRKGEVITDKMYPNGYYTWIDTSECLAYTQSQLHETTAPSALRAPPSSKEAEKVPPSRGGENYEEKEGGVID